MLDCTIAQLMKYFRLTELSVGLRAAVDKAPPADLALTSPPLMGVTASQRSFRP